MISLESWPPPPHPAKGTPTKEVAALRLQVQTLAKELHHAGKELVWAADALRAHGANTVVVSKPHCRGERALAKAGIILDV